MLALWVYLALGLASVGYAAREDVAKFLPELAGLLVCVAIWPLAFANRYRHDRRRKLHNAGVALRRQTNMYYSLINRRGWAGPATPDQIEAWWNAEDLKGQS